MSVNRGIVVLAKSVTLSRIDENNKLLKLDDEDMAVLNSIYKEKGPKRFVPSCLLVWSVQRLMSWGFRFITPPWPINFGFPDWKQGAGAVFEAI